MIRRLLAALIRPLYRLILRYLPIHDPWERFGVRPRLDHFGPGARQEFGWYFEGDSAVLVSNLDEILDWLTGCEYASDPHLFQEPDYWQHPRTFEHLRQGDCEDFALWAWRKLLEVGYDADLVFGHCQPLSLADSRHAWIVFRRDGTEYLFEPTMRDRALAVRPLEAVRTEYIPEFGVGPDKRAFSFAGFLYAQKFLKPTAAV